MLVEESMEDLFYCAFPHMTPALPRNMRDDSHRSRPAGSSTLEARNPLSLSLPSRAVRTCGAQPTRFSERNGGGNTPPTGQSGWTHCSAV